MLLVHLKKCIDSILIKNGLPKKDMFKIIKETVIDQKRTLDSMDIIKTLKKQTSSTFVDHQKKIMWWSLINNSGDY